MTAIVIIVAPKIELAIRLKNASSERDATNFTASSERGKHRSTTALFENASENNNVLQIPNVNDETSNNVPDKVSELSVPETRFDWQSNIHHMVTG